MDGVLGDPRRVGDSVALYAFSRFQTRNRSTRSAFVGSDSSESNRSNSSIVIGIGIEWGYGIRLYKHIHVSMYSRTPRARGSPMASCPDRRGRLSSGHRRKRRRTEHGPTIRVRLKPRAPDRPGTGSDWPRSNSRIRRVQRTNSSAIPSSRCRRRARQHHQDIPSRTSRSRSHFSVDRPRSTHTRR